MYYLFKEDPWGNKIPVYAAQTDSAIMHIVKNSKINLMRTWVPGNTRTLMGI